MGLFSRTPRWVGNRQTPSPHARRDGLIAAATAAPTPPLPRIAGSCLPHTAAGLGRSEPQRPGGWFMLGRGGPGPPEYKMVTPALSSCWATSTSSPFPTCPGDS